MLQQNYAAAGKKQTYSSESESPMRNRNPARAHTDTAGAMRAIFGAGKYRWLNFARSHIGSTSTRPPSPMTTTLGGVQKDAPQLRCDDRICRTVGFKAFFRQVRGYRRALIMLMRVAAAPLPRSLELFRGVSCFQLALLQGNGRTGDFTRVTFRMLAYPGSCPPRLEIESSHLHSQYRSCHGHQMHTRRGLLNCAPTKTLGTGTFK